MVGVEHRRVDRRLQVAARTPRGRGRTRATTGPAGRRRACRTPARCRRRRPPSRARASSAAAAPAPTTRQALLEPEHLRARAEAEAEPGDAGRALQPPAARRGRHEVAEAVGDVEVAGVAARRLAGARDGRRRPPAAHDGSRPVRAPGAARREASRRSAPAAPRVPRREQRLQRHRRRVAVPRLAVGERELRALDHARARARRRGTARARPSTIASCCRNTGPWPHGPVLNTVQSPEAQRDAAARRRGERARSSPEPACAARAVERRPRGRDDRLRHPPAVPGVARGVDPRLARCRPPTRRAARRSSASTGLRSRAPRLPQRQRRPPTTARSRAIARTIPGVAGNPSRA